MSLLQYPSDEYGLIAELQSILGKMESASYETGIGDDAAVRSCADGGRIVLTADLTVENVHFNTDYMSLEEVGYRAMVSNVSDCAAMGALPESALVQLVFPNENGSLKDDIKKLYTGFSSACVKWKFPIVGGDLSSGERWVIGITLIGKIPEGGRAVMRKGARDGDRLWVTGMPGRSAAGFEALKKWGRQGVPGGYKSLVQAHIAPEPRVEQGFRLASCDQVHAMMDLSDGISKDAGTLGYENDLGILLSIDSIHPPMEMIQLSNELRISTYKNWILHGGEDYELLFAASEAFDPATMALNDAVCIGVFTSRFRGIRELEMGMEKEVSPLSWDHFKRALH